MDDAKALDHIAAALAYDPTGEGWNADTLDAIAQYVDDSGRSTEDCPAWYVALVEGTPQS